VLTFLFVVSPFSLPFSSVVNVQIGRGEGAKSTYYASSSSALLVGEMREKLRALLPERYLCGWIEVPSV